MRKSYRNHKQKDTYLNVGLVVPETFRIGDVTTLPDRDRFAISETRITATYLKAFDWADDDVEAGVAIAEFSLRLDRGKLWKRWMPSVMISAHALARWFERTGHRDHAMLVRDITALARTADCGDGIAVADGCWLGGMTLMRGPDRAEATVLNIRTFVAEGSRRAGPRCASASATGRGRACSGPGGT
jgi:hypothetical protein